MSDASSISAQALGVFGTALDVTAHNIANVSTEGYRSYSTNLADGQNGRGVQVADIARAKDPGVDVATEMVGLIQTSDAYSANATMRDLSEKIMGPKRLRRPLVPSSSSSSGQ